MLRVRRGDLGDAVAVMEKRYGKLHPLHELLVTRFGGFLELSITLDHWQNSAIRDGVRVYGVSPNHLDCDLESHLEVYRNLVKQSDNGYDASTKKNAARWSKMLPILSNLGGINDAWVASASAIDWFRYGALLVSPRGRGTADRDEPMHPRFGPPFALVARLMNLEERLVDIERAKSVARMASAVEAGSFDGRGRWVLDRDPSIALEITADLRRRPTDAERGVAVTVDIGPIRKHAGAIAPLFLQRIEAANAAAPAVRYFDDHDWLWARTDLRDGLTSSEIACAIARVVEAREAFAKSRPFAFDDEPQPIPADVLDVLRTTRADLPQFNARFSSKGHMPDVREVVCVGRQYPRIRWSFSVDDDGRYFHERTYRQTPMAHWLVTRRNGRNLAEYELLCSSITSERIERAMQTIPIEDRSTNESSDYTTDEQRQVDENVLRIAEGTLRGLDVEGADPGGPDFWRAVASTTKLTCNELERRLALHRGWLANSKQKTHRWEARSWMNLVFAVYRTDEGTLAQGDLSHCDLRGVALADLKLTACKMVNSLAMGVDFSRASLDHAMAVDSDMTGARFDGARLVGTDFSRTSLRGASFRNADCTDVDFENCDLTDCDFTGAKIEGLKTKGAVNPPGQN